MRILVIDDDPMIRRMAGFILKKRDMDIQKQARARKA